VLIDRMNINLLRIFECVYRNGSMTKAAEELFITQSGISQNIKHLEEVLDLQLFDRIKKKAIPTYKAHRLYEVCSKHLYDIERGLMEVTEKDYKFIGTIRLGIPIEFGNRFVLPHLAEWSRIHPGIKYHIQYGHATDMHKQLLEGKIDFAIIDNFKIDKRVVCTRIGMEILTLCASTQLLETFGEIKMERKYFEKLPYVDYVEGAPILNSWFSHHLGIKNMKINLNACLMDVQGIAQMIKKGLGAGVLPLHVASRIKRLSGDIHIFKGKGQPQVNEISLAYLDERLQNPSVDETIKYLKEKLSEEFGQESYIQ
jgi:LysR family transcriptional regulator, transcriptional activator of the cysJI operon